MIAQMLRCPTCSGMAEPKARFCTSCYTVFPSGSRAGHRRFEAATTNKTTTWKGPFLFLVAAALGAWFVQTDAEDWTAEPGSYRATARDVKREILAWFDPSIIAWKGGASARLQWSLDNDDRLPCDSGSLCDVVIHFATGESASYIIGRPNRGGARIIAHDSHGDELLAGSTRARLEAAEPAQTAQSISIARGNDGRWSIVGEANPTPTDANAGEPGSMEGVGQ